MEKVIYTVGGFCIIYLAAVDIWLPVIHFCGEDAPAEELRYLSDHK